MAKFMCTHTIPPGKFSTDQLRQFAQAAQQDPDVKGYRSFANLAEGKAVCFMEAAGKDAVAAWFNKVGMPYDSITKVELEGAAAPASRPDHASSEPGRCPAVARVARRGLGC